MTPTFRYHPSIVAQVFGTLGAMFPGRVVLGVGTGESLNEVPSSGIAWPGAKERRDRLREVDRADQQIVDRGPGHLRGPVLPDRERDDLRQAEREGADLGRRSGPLAAQMAGQIAEGFICTSGKAPQLYSEQLVPKVEEGRHGAAATRRRSNA